MENRTKAPALALVGVAAVALAAWLVLSSDGNGTDAADVGTAAAVATGGELPEGAEPPLPSQPAADVEPLVVDATAAPATPAASAETWPGVRATGEGALEGVVLDKEDHRPVPGAAVRVRPTTGETPFLIEVSDERSGSWRATTDEQGRFSFARLPAGAHRVEAEAADGRRGDAAATVLTGPETPFVQVTVSDREARWSVPGFVARVLDGQGAPRAGVAVTLHARDDAEHVDGTGRGARVTDAAGEASFEGVQMSSGLLFADGGEAGVARVDLWRADTIRKELRNEADGGGRTRDVLEVRLAEPGVLTGRIDVAEGLTAPSTLRAWALSTPSLAYSGTQAAFDTSVDPDGRFAWPRLPAGRYSLALPGAEGRLECVVGLAARAKDDVAAVEVSAGATTEVVLALGPAAALAGTVRDEAGEPLAGATVRAVLPRGLVSDPLRVKRRGAHYWRFDGQAVLEALHPRTATQSRTDGAGRYAFAGLDPGEWRVDVLAEGRAYGREDPVSVALGETATVDFTLPRAGALHGVAWHWASLGLRRVGQEDFDVAFLCAREPEPHFTIPLLAPGTYEMASLHSNPSVEPTPLGTVEIVAGETAWVDLRHASPHVARGRVLLRGQPVAGAELDFLGVRCTTDAAGVFAYHHPFTYSGVSSFDVTVPDLPDAVRVRAAVQDLCLPGNGTPDIHLPTGRLEVEVQDRDGLPLAASIVLAPGRGNTSVGGFGGQAGFEFRRPLDRPTDAAGRVAFDLLPGGHYLVSAHLDGPGWVPPASVTVAADGVARLTLVPPASGAVRVVVQDADGLPVPHEPVSIQLVGEDGGYTVLPVGARTDASGTLLLDGVPVGRAEAVVTRGRFMSQRSSREPFEVREGETAEVVLPLP